MPAKKKAAPARKRTPTLKRETLKDLRAKDSQKVRGGQKPYSCGSYC